MFKLLQNYTHFTGQQGNAQNPASQASTVGESKSSRYSSWIEKRQRNQIANICWIIEKAREFQKNICFIVYTKAFVIVWITTNWEILKEMGIPDHLTCLLRNLHADQEAAVRIRQGTTDWFQIGKGVRQCCILSPCLFNFMQSKSWEMLDWMKHKQESRLLGEISIASGMHMTPPLWQQRRTKEPLDESERGE